MINNRFNIVYHLLCVVILFWIFIYKLKDVSKSNEMRRLIDDFKKFIIKESQYLGSCIEVGDDNSCNYINDIFSDATEMAYYVGDPDWGDFGQSVEITKEEFFKNVNVSIMKNKQYKGDIGFYYIPNLKIYYIYNFDNGIHYFYK